MKDYESDRLRNVALMGHGSCGKSTLAEALLFASGALSRMGRVEDRNTVSDFDEQEHSHQYSISSSMIPIEWAGHRINLIDTPGYADFEGEVVSAAAAADAALIAVDAASGVESGTEVAWQLADEAGGLPRMLLVTRLDREFSDFRRVFDQLRDRFGTRLVPLALPIGEAQELAGVVDVLAGTAHRGAEPCEVPEEMADAVAEARELLVESVAESDDDLLGRYLEGETIGDDELTAALHAGVAEGTVVPVLPVCATRDIGLRTLLDEVVRLLPSPLGREHRCEDGGTIVTSAEGPFVAHVFKTTADPFVGHLSFMKVLSGQLTPDMHPHNPRSRQAERLGHLYVQRGKEQIEVPALVAGDIGVAAKLQATSTGDVLTAAAEATVALRPIPFPNSTYRSALHPHSKDDVDKLSSALHRITEQDPTIRVERDPDTHETVMTTLGEAQVTVAVARLAKVYGVAVDVEAPRVPYRETISAPVKAEYKHKKQSGGHGQYGHVVIELSPLDRGEGFKFEDRVSGGTVPRQFIPAVEKGIAETLPAGPLAHSPVVDLRVTLLDGSSHSVDSSEMAFKTAASQALKQGVLGAQPVLLEPVMRMRIRVPSASLGDVMSDVSTKRGHVHGVEADGDITVVEAEAPLAEVQRYANDLRALTGGRGRFDLEFDRYVEVPAHVQQGLLDALRTAEANGHS
ncbi:MAG: elongation factor G [Dehalococcoidia bacterium]|nr:elongation factor G [Dehalococcoidia bacterium]